MKHLKHSTTYCLTRGDQEIELEIDYDINPFDPGSTSGPPEHCYPPEGGDVTDVRATLDGEEFPLTDKEEEEICKRIEATHDHSYDDRGDYYDEDY